MEIGTLEFVMASARAVMASLALSYEVETGTPQNDIELQCMAQNIYFEGRAEPMVGKIAIGHVVMNRVKSKNFPNTICEVVHQGPIRESWKTKKDPTLAKEDRIFYPRRDRCQFSWWCDGNKDIIWATYKSGKVIDQNMTAWRDSIHVALFIMNGDYGTDPTDGADHYYNPHIATPYWGAIFEETSMIGNHRFMKENK